MSSGRKMRLKFPSGSDIVSAIRDFLPEGIYRIKYNNKEEYVYVGDRIFL